MPAIYNPNTKYYTNISRSTSYHYRSISYNTTSTRYNPNMYLKLLDLNIASQ